MSAHDAAPKLAAAPLSFTPERVWVMPHGGGGGGHHSSTFSCASSAAPIGRFATSSSRSSYGKEFSQVQRLIARSTSEKSYGKTPIICVRTGILRKYWNMRDLHTCRCMYMSGCTPVSTTSSHLLVRFTPVPKVLDAGCCDPMIHSTSSASYFEKPTKT